MARVFDMLVLLLRPLSTGFSRVVTKAFLYHGFIFFNNHGVPCFLVSSSDRPSFVFTREKPFDAPSFFCCLEGCMDGRFFFEHSNSFTGVSRQKSKEEA